MPREEKNSTGVCVLATNRRVDEILVLHRHAGAALAAAALRAIGRQRHALDVAGMGDGDDHVLAGDQVLVVHVGPPVGDLGAARRGELVPDLGTELVLDDRPGCAGATTGCRDNP
jgi:hypothetical protein